MSCDDQNVESAYRVSPSFFPGLLRQTALVLKAFGVDNTLQDSKLTIGIWNEGRPLKPEAAIKESLS